MSCLENTLTFPLRIRLPRVSHHLHQQASQSGVGAAFPQAFCLREVSLLHPGVWVPRLPVCGPFSSYQHLWRNTTGRLCNRTDNLHWSKWKCKLKPNTSVCKWKNIFCGGKEESLKIGGWVYIVTKEKNRLAVYLMLYKEVLIGSITGSLPNNTYSVTLWHMGHCPWICVTTSPTDCPSYQNRYPPQHGSWLPRSRSTCLIFSLKYEHTWQPQSDSSEPAACGPASILRGKSWIRGTRFSGGIMGQNTLQHTQKRAR